MTIASLAKDAADAKSVLQAQLLADGAVTVEEYAQTSEQMLKCVRASGMTVTYTELSPLDGFSSDAVFRASPCEMV